MDDAPEPAEVERELRARMTLDDGEHGEPAPTPGPGPLRRRSSRRWLAGVAAGLADRWQVPALLLRIPLAVAAAVVALTIGDTLSSDGSLTLSPSAFGLPALLVLVSWLAVGAYLVLWALVPREDVGVAPARRVLRRHPGLRSWPAYTMLALGGVLLADRLGIFDPTVAVAIGLIALGIWLFRWEGRPEPVDRGPAAPASPSEPAEDEQPPAGEPRPPRERSPLGWIALGAALLVSSLAAIWLTLGGSSEGAGGVATGLSRIVAGPALALLVLGAGLVVGSVYGRARWLIVPATLLVPLVLVTSSIRLPLDGRFGDLSVRPNEPGQLRGAYTNTAGNLFVDLNRFRGRDEVVDLPLRLTTVVGSATVVLPYDASYEVRGYAGLGSVSVGPIDREGVEVSAAARFVSPFEGGPSFVLDLEAGVGNVAVYLSVPNRRIDRQIREALERRFTETVA